MLKNRADSENYLLCKKIKLYVPYGKSADLNPRHAVLERLLKAQNCIDKPLFKPNS